MRRISPRMIEYMQTLYQADCDQKPLCQFSTDIATIVNRCSERKWIRITEKRVAGFPVVELRTAGLRFLQRRGIC